MGRILLKLSNANRFDKKLTKIFSEKILLFPEDKLCENNLSNTKICLKTDLSKEELFKLGKSYFYGLNDYPINYTIALYYFKLAADKDHSEAQWRYALMVENSLGTNNKDFSEIERYLKKSARNNSRGKLLYCLFSKANSTNINIFDKLINELCQSGNLDAKYYYAMHLEELGDLDKSMLIFQETANEGHLDSLIQLIYLSKYKSKTELYEKFLNLSASLLNEDFLVKLINIYNKKKSMTNLIF